MPNIKSINAYLHTLEIKYGVYVVKIHFDFKANTFRAFTESGNNLFEFNVDDKRKYLSIIDECLTKAGIKHTKVIFDISKADYGNGLHEVIRNDPVCYINPDDMFNWITLQKMKGVIQWVILKSKLFHYGNR